MRYRSALALGGFSFLMSFGAAYAAGSSSNPTPTAAANVATVNQAATQTVVRTVSNAIGGSLSRVFQSGNMFQRDTNARKVSLNGETTGLSTGESSSGFAAWSSVDYTRLYVVPDGDKEQRRITNIYTAVVGADAAITDSVLGGVALSYTRAGTDGRTTRAARLDQDSDSITVSPYLGWAITDRLTADTMVGYTHSFITTRDYTYSPRANAKNSSDTLFAAVNLAYTMPLTDALAVKGFTGFSGQYGKTYGFTDDQGHTVRDNDAPHWQARVGAKLMAAVTDSSQVYFSAAYERERHMKALTENSARLTVGTATKLTSAIDFVVEGGANVGRETQQEYGAAANIRWSF